MLNYTSHFNTQKTPQSEPIPGANQVPNSGGGYAYAIDKWAQFNRFLILGSEGGTYYASERALTKENAENVIACIKEDGDKAVKQLVTVSDSGRAAKNDAAIFALALACTFGDQKTKQSAYQHIKDVCRIGTYLFQFCQNIQDLRGWSRGLRSGVSKFYLSKSSDEIAYQLIKYRQRNGWTHKDVMRLAHPKTSKSVKFDLLRYAVGKQTTSIHNFIAAFEKLQVCTDMKEACALIETYNLPREAVPTPLLNCKEVWATLLDHMPMTAMIRNLGKMTNAGLLTSNFDTSAKKVMEKLVDFKALKAARVHPLHLLTALKIYRQGHGDKGKLTWSPVQGVVSALQDAFYLSFDTIQPTLQNWLLGLDVSGSMHSSSIQNSPLTAREAAAAMAMVTVRTEPNYKVMAFSGGFIPLKLSKHDSLEAVLKKTDALAFSSTDCSLPMLYAIQKKLPIDMFAIYTDNETNSGGIHPSQALQAYRNQSGRQARLAVVGMTATGFSIADPKDKLMLDVVGFDTATPQVMSDFARGNI